MHLIYHDENFHFQYADEIFQFIHHDETFHFIYLYEKRFRVGVLFSHSEYKHILFQFFDKNVELIDQ